jgi:acyl-CoA thioester hydrolase
MQMHNGSAALLRARSPRLYVTQRRLLQGATRQPTWGPRKPWPTQHIVEKLRFADTDRNGHISNAVFAVRCQNARMEIVSDPNRAAVPDGVHIVIARLQLDLLGDMHRPGRVEIGTRVEHIGRSSVVLARAKPIVVSIDAATRRATPLPAPLINALYEVGQYAFRNRLSRSFPIRSAIKGVPVRL